MADMSFTAGLDDRAFRRNLRGMGMESDRTSRRIETGFGRVAGKLLTVALAAKATTSVFREMNQASAEGAAMAEQWGKGVRELKRFGVDIVHPINRFLMRDVFGRGEEVDRRTKEIQEAQTLPEDAARKRFERSLQRGSIDILEGTGQELEARRRSLILEYDELIDALNAETRLSRTDRDRFRKLIDQQRDIRLGLIKAEKKEAEKMGMLGIGGVSSSQVRGALGAVSAPPQARVSEAEQRRADAQQRRKEAAIQHNQLREVNKNLEAIQRAMDAGARANGYQ